MVKKDRLEEIYKRYKKTHRLTENDVRVIVELLVIKKYAKSLKDETNTELKNIRAELYMAYTMMVYSFAIKPMLEDLSAFLEKIEKGGK